MQEGSPFRSLLPGYCLLPPIYIDSLFEANPVMTGTGNPPTTDLATLSLQRVIYKTGRLFQEPSETFNAASAVSGEKEVEPGVILIIEDDPHFAELADSYLTIAGYKTLLATDGKAALEIYSANKQQISLVVLDLIMPRMPGEECMIELLKINPSVRILVVSILDPGDPFCRSLSPYIRGFVQKPCRMAQLLAATTSALTA